MNGGQQRNELRNLSFDETTHNYIVKGMHITHTGRHLKNLVVHIVVYIVSPTHLRLVVCQLWSVRVVYKLLELWG